MVPRPGRFELWKSVILRRRLYYTQFRGGNLCRSGSLVSFGILA